ncbi:MAG: T9SS type A sorting domain-containing protein, partial [candidate division Zixibacteria bacterium]|nr:T9SS type A sorting domain-containing protein [candidate division Zixibacteria bacterium]
STYFGGSDADEEYEPRLILDEEGFVYITGNTSSDDFPTTTGAYSENFSGGLKDRFISKFDADLTTLISSTFIGGGGEETGMGITLDSVGNIYIAGYSTSTDFPTTSGSYDETHNGGRDAYISKLNNDMTTLISSTYIGGSEDEGYRWPRIDLIIGENMEIYVAGLTKSADFPTTANVYDTTYNGGGNILQGGDAFVSKFTADLSQLLSSTYLGGSDDEWRVSFVLDDDENIIICGDTQSGDYPTTPGVYDRTFNGGFYDVFVSKFSSDLTTLSASTFLGSNGGDDALAIRLDNDGNVGLTGYTTSPSFPTTTGAYDRTYNGGERDAFIVKLDNELSNIQTSTFLGGSSSDTGEDFIIDGNGNFYIVGVTTSSDFPTSNDAYDISYNGGGDIFISKLDYNLSTLQSSTYIGGNNEEKGQCIDIDNSGNIYTISRTKSYNLPVTENSYNNTFNGGFNDCYIAKLDSSLSANPSSVDDREPLLHSLMLYNYPNPFNSSTTISYIIPTASYIRLNIYNILGSKIETIVNESQSKGLHNVIWDSKMFPSGIYFCKLNAGDYTETLRFSLIK